MKLSLNLLFSFTVLVYKIEIIFAFQSARNFCISTLGLRDFGCAPKSCSIFAVDRGAVWGLGKLNRNLYHPKFQDGSKCFSITWRFKCMQKLRLIPFSNYCTEFSSKRSGKLITILYSLVIKF